MYTVHGVALGLDPEPVRLRDQADFQSCVCINPIEWDRLVREVLGR